MTYRREQEKVASGDDKRRQAVECCDACGGRALCTRMACPHCEILHSTCGACDRETGGRALLWQVEGHVRRAHMPQVRRSRDEIQHRRVSV